MPWSIIALVASNGVTLLGVLYWGWKLEDILILAWAENLVIGFWNIPRFFLCAKPKGSTIGRAIHLGSRVSMCLFFIVHYGMFTFVHGIFIRGFVESGHRSHGTDSNFFDLLGMVRPLQIAFLAIVASHGVSFFYNFLWREEYKQVGLSQVMLRPYLRIVVVHVTIILGGMLATALGSTLPVLVVLLVLKTIVDLFAHRFEHRMVETSREKMALGRLSYREKEDPHDEQAG